MNRLIGLFYLAIKSPDLIEVYNVKNLKVSAITFGNVILYSQSINEVTDELRQHELVHVQQYKKYGIFFLPMYLYYSIVAWLKGLDPYYDNNFEIEAYKKG